MSSIVLKRDLDRGFMFWHISQIYTGITGSVTRTLHVPNVGDLVFDGGDTIYKVIALDEANPKRPIPTLEAINPSSVFHEQITNPDSLPDGLRYYQPHGTNRCFIDNSTNPATVSIDARYRAFGSEATQAKLFLGRDTSEATGTVLSQKLNSSNVLLSEMIDLVPLFATNNTIKRPERFHTTISLDDGEIVTLVLYNASGRVCGEHPFIVRNANMIAGPTATNIYIEDIELVSAMLSESDPLLIENPLNVPFAINQAQCRVHYSNGSQVTIPIDGNKAALHGIEHFNTGTLGPVRRVVLNYYPGPDEPAINVQGSIRPHIPKTYRLQNKRVDDPFALKLFVVPVWTGAGYQLRFRLTDIDYALDVDVTQYVNMTLEDGTPFKPTAYGLEQTVIVTLNMDVSNPGQFPGHIHVQSFKITLQVPGSESTNDWVIDYGGGGFTYFGAGHFATASLLGTKRFKLDLNLNSRLDWLGWLYWALDPAFDPSLSDRAPVPTHFRLEQGGPEGRNPIGTFSLDQWNQEFELGATRNWEQNYPLNIVWLVIDNGIEKTLAIAPLSIKYIYAT